MKPIHVRPAISVLLVAAAACVPKAAPPPVQTPPAPVPSAPPVQAPAFDNWMDAPATAGDWRYSGVVARFVATAGELHFTMRCDAATRGVMLSRAGTASGAAGMTIRTEALTRTLAASSQSGATPSVEARLSGSDRLLDAMAFSKGRFAVEVPGAPPLYLPSWAEVTRVIEDCR